MPNFDLDHRRALVLDWDGTIRHNPNGDFINQPSDLEWYDGMVEALWKYREAGWLVLGATNQGGIAHGHKSLDSFYEEVEEMKMWADLQHLDGWPFHLWEFCPRMKSGEGVFGEYSLMRKPRTGMLAKMEDWLRKEEGIHVQWQRSVFVGDAKTDLECARRAGMARFVWAEPWREWVRSESFDPDATLEIPGGLEPFSNNPGSAA